MRTYYRGPDAVVTDTHFVRQSPTVRVFAIAELHDVRLVRSTAGGPSGMAVALGFGVFAVAVMTGIKFGVTAAIPLLVAVCALVLVGVRRRHERAFEIRARYRAHEVTIYASGDARTFNQVTRALRRTFEKRERQAYGLAAG